MDDTIQQNQSNLPTQPDLQGASAPVQPPESVTPPVQKPVVAPSAKPHQPGLGGRQMQAPTATPPVQAVGGPANREHEPASAPQPDVVKMTEPEIIREEEKVERELETIIEKTPDTEKPEIPKEVQNAGVTLAKEAIPMPAGPTGSVVLPMTYQEAELTNKNYKWKDSVSWLASLIMYHWKKLGFKPSTKKT